jgi:hypothetical protein
VRQKISETPISTNKLGMVVHDYHPRYEGGIKQESQSRLLREKP